MELSSSYKLLYQATIILSAFSPPSFTTVSAHIDQAPCSIAARQKGGDLRYKNKICLTAGVKTAATTLSHLLTESPHLGLGVQQENFCCQGWAMWCVWSHKWSQSLLSCYLVEQDLLARFLGKGQFNSTAAAISSLLSEKLMPKVWWWFSGL